MPKVNGRAFGHFPVTLLNAENWIPAARVDVSPTAVRHADTKECNVRVYHS